MRGPELKAADRDRFFARLGRSGLGLLEYSGGATLLLGQTLRGVLSSPARRWGQALQQLERVGWQSLPVVAFMSFFIGMAVAFQISYQMHKLAFAADLYLPSFAALMILREIGPVLTGLIIAGRVGAASAAELGTMRISGQIDALRALASNPVRYLVVPRLAALCLGLPLLTLYADAIGLAGGYLVGTTQLALSPTLYWQMSARLITSPDLFTGLIKALVFAVIIATISSFEGLRARGGAKGVGRATTRAVVISFVLIIAADALFTAAFYAIGG
ncbi:MAG TPA: ABC transporter permease [Candidatus Fraserbacteria bacterium]|nr:ABC transporter permease [Candidatus Fraserbacteria bacterium]